MQMGNNNLITITIKLYLMSEKKIKIQIAIKRQAKKLHVPNKGGCVCDLDILLNEHCFNHFPHTIFNMICRCERELYQPYSN